MYTYEYTHGKFVYIHIHKTNVSVYLDTCIRIHTYLCILFP